MPEQPTGGFVTSERTGPDEITTVIITPDGASTHTLPTGGITEDDLLPE